PALAIRSRSVMAVDVAYQIARHAGLEVSGSHRTRIHRTIVNRFGVGQHDDHFSGAPGECALDRLRNPYFLDPLLGTDGIAVQRIDNGIAAMGALRVAWRKDNENIAVGCLAFQVSRYGRRVDLDPLDRNRPCADDRLGGIGADLGFESGG